MAQAIRTVSKTLEGQLFEIIQAISALQENPLNNPDSIKYLSGTFSPNNLNYTGSFDFPFESRMSPQGEMIFTVKNCLVNSPIDS